MAPWWGDFTASDSNGHAPHEPRRHRDCAFRQPRAEDRREPRRPGSGHQGVQDPERQGRDQRSVLRRRGLPPRHRRLHDPGWRPHRHRPRRPGLPVRRRVPPRAAVRPRLPARDGERRPGHQRLAVLHHRRPTPHLNRRHTIFGEVVDAESKKVVDAIATTATDRADRPVDDVVINSITIS
ncbi:peptidyl prolyl isomerase [Rhodococcus pyridinivorans AK37]|uniref:Peptidyl prolyl isomerase n=1 Tax=Rhodococcus pyridinivorans AK37 TaxID=1114960 RepID=H0JME4_9NOCA|nr:peptidyl prolyl isomerase [Rhodococcus pyridinivorans AK37]